MFISVSPYVSCFFMLLDWDIDNRLSIRSIRIIDLTRLFRTTFSATTFIFLNLMISNDFIFNNKKLLRKKRFFNINKVFFRLKKKTEVKSWSNFSESNYLSLWRLKHLLTQFFSIWKESKVTSSSIWGIKRKGTWRHQTATSNKNVFSALHYKKTIWKFIV